MITVPRRYRFVVQDRDRHGNVRTYLRRPGHPKVRLQHEPGTDEFDVEYRAIIEGEAATPVKPQPIGVVAAGSVKAAVIAYYGSSAFKQLDKRTQHVRRLILGHFVDAHGDKPFNRIETRHVVKWRDEKADTPEAANGLLKALRGVFKHAVATAVIPRNIVRDVPYIPSKGDGFHTWSMDEVRQFEAHWPIGSMARLALALLLMTGQRRSDVVQLGQQHLRDGVLTFTQVKNRLRKPMRLALPVMPELAAMIAATPRKGMTFLENEQGKPYTAETFGNRFRVWARAAGLGHCTPHGLRKAAAVRLAEMGASAHELKAVLGHRTLHEVERYTRAAEQAGLAQSAFNRLSARPMAGEVSHSGAPTQKWDEMTRQPTDRKDAEICMVPRTGFEPVLQP